MYCAPPLLKCEAGAKLNSVLETFTKIGEHAAQQATMILAQETFGMVDSVALIHVEQGVDRGEEYFTLRWQALSMGIALCDVAMVLLPEFLNSAADGQSELTDQAASYLVENTIRKLRDSAEDDE